MEEEENQQDQVSFLLSDFNTRLRDTEEKNRLVKDRVLLLGKNFIENKEQTEEEIKEIKKQTFQVQKELKQIQSTLSAILSEIKKFTKKDEIVLVERMLKDFQPLEFVREKDVKELIKKELKSTKTIKTKKTTK